MTMQNRKLSLDEVLDEFFYNSDAPDAQKIQEAIDAYPEYRQDIVEFSALWASYESSPELDEEFRPSQVSDLSVSKVQSFILNRLHELEQSGQRDTAADLDAAKKSISNLAGNSLRKAADAAGLYGSSALLQKVLNNSIRNVPQRVLANLAMHLQVTIDALSGALLERGVGGGRSYKAADKPTVSQVEAWSSAVNRLPLMDEQKQMLIALQDKE